MLGRRSQSLISSFRSEIKCGDFSLCFPLVSRSAPNTQQLCISKGNFLFLFFRRRWWYFVYTSSADVSSVPASASCNCWVIDCKTGIISSLVFDPIKRRRCRRTGVRLSPSVSWSFLLHHNIQPPQKKHINISPGKWKWVCADVGRKFPSDGAREAVAATGRAGSFRAISFFSFVPADHESFIASVICRPRSVLWKTSTSRTKFTINSWTYEWFSASKRSETNPIPFRSPWRCNNAGLEVTKAANSYILGGKSWLLHPNLCPGDTRNAC